MPDNHRSRALIEKTRDNVGRVASLYNPRTWKEKGLTWTAGLLVVTYVIVSCVLGLYWSLEPNTFNVREVATNQARGEANRTQVAGWVTTGTAIYIGEVLLSKPGGYIRNDIAPPGLLMDNMPEWEFGVLTLLRDTSRHLRNDFSRSQTQSTEDPNLAEAQSFFNNDASRWMLPSPEGQYENGLEEWRTYQMRLADANDRDGQFFARADNLRSYLNEANTRLGGYAQGLAASVGQERINIDLAGDRNATQSTPVANQTRVQTPWLEIDNIFFEARGYSWALLHMLQAIEVDFVEVLADKNARPLLQQIVRELEGAQQTLTTRYFVLNGKGFGLFPNHSLVLASYLSRANAAMIDLRTLLQQG